MFSKKREIWDGRNALIVSDLGDYSLTDTLECGQAFRYELITSENGYVEYMTVVGDELITVGQRAAGELIFYDLSDEVFEESVVRYFSLDTDYRRIRADIVSRTDSAWLKQAAESAKGVAILKQDEWEALFSFIVSQNNNIPRIRKIIRELSAAYGVNICLQKNIKKCPLGKISGIPCEENCKSCGSCYTFPSAESVVKNPEKMLPAKPGFRYKYLLSAAESVLSGDIDITAIAEKKSYSHTVEELKKMMREYANHGKTVFVTSHNIELVAKICDRVAIVNQGKVMSLFDLNRDPNKRIQLAKIFMDTYRSH